MSLFSNDMRVANTAAPSFQSQANVGQYGWTGADQGHYNQLVQYVDECRKIWLNLGEKISYVEELLKDVDDIDAQVKYIEQIANEVSKWRTEVIAARDQTTNMYNQLLPEFADFTTNYEDFSNKYTDIVKMHSETEQAAIAAAVSANEALVSANEAKEIAEELRQGNVYRGTWNPHTGSYPNNGGTNSTWDVILNEGELEYTWNGILWFWGDRLVYLKNTNEYQQIESGGSVSSVNGKKGAVTLVAADVNAINKDTDTMKGALYFGDKNKYISLNDKFLYVAAKEGHVVIEGKNNPVARVGGYDRVIYHTGNKPTANEIGAVTAAGFTLEGPVKVGNGPQNIQNLMGDNMIRSGGAGSHATVVGNTSGRTYIDSPDDILFLRAAGVERRVYTTGFKPSLDDLGALGSKGSQVLEGTLQVNPGTLSDPISLTQTFNASGANAQGISGYNSKDITKRAWGVGAYANSGNVEYTYLGVGESPWATGIRIKPTAVESYQPLYVAGSINATVPSGGEAFVLNYNSGNDGGVIRAKEGGNLDWYVGRANSAGDVALYSNKQSSGVILRKGQVEFSGAPRVGGAGTVFYTKPLSTTDLNTLNGTVNHGMYYQDASANATTARNYPATEAGSLIVMGGAYGAQQEYTTYNSNRKFIRGKIDNNTWLAWNELGGVKDHCSAYRINAQVIGVGVTAVLVPGVFPSAQGITSSNGDFNIAKGGTYKIEWGFSIEPSGATQNGVGSIWVNGAKKFDAVIYNYCPISSSTNGAQMGTSGTTVITQLSKGDKVSFRVQAVNSTSVRIYQAGYMTITQL